MRHDQVDGQHRLGDPVRQHQGWWYASIHARAVLTLPRRRVARRPTSPMRRGRMMAPGAPSVSVRPTQASCTVVI